ncbi:hypothetical protein P4E94_02100 [Pontiellaceae bacterium B12219]|nr:hypothetical protein [Pontiellaceae bacterium B12219]
MNQPQSIVYWDVFPKLIRVSTSDQPQSIPLSLRGNVETPLFFSSNPLIADVDESGVVICGMQPGAAVLTICRSEELDSIRSVQVEVYGAPISSGALPT